MRLELEGVGHRYGSLEVLDGITLSVAEREVLAVVGPSGCGKSTLLAILGGLERPGSGRVWASGPTPEGCVNPITTVFQDFALLPWRTVRENVAFVLDGRVAAADVAVRVEAVLAVAGLADFAEALPRQLSGGMRQRVGIARALAVNPAVLLMDEPLSALDAQTRALMLEDFRRLFEQLGCTVVYVTHTLSEAVLLAHRVVVLSRRPGRIRQVLAIDVPPAARDPGEPRLLALEAELWRLIQDDARAAERELDGAA